MKVVKGFYNAKFYCVELDGKEVFRAGNCLTSLEYVSAEQGVGLDKMGEFCNTACQVIADNEAADFVGTHFLDMNV